MQTRMPDYHYEEDFGGVFYVFIRGVNAEYGPQYGIYHDLPDAHLIHELDRLMIS
jgi:exodeoxyribonuclease V beta subunit